QLDTEPLQLTLRALDVVLADAVAGAARTRVQDEPDVAGLVETQLAEVIDAAHRAELLAHVAGRDLRRALHHCGIALAELLVPRAVRCRRSVAVRALADRDDLLDRSAETAQIGREILGAQHELLRDHAAADVDGDRGRHDPTD